jgi:Tfp pilus assembly protein PilX
MIHTMKRQALVREEAAFVSIFSVLIIMTVLTLVLVGFSAITRQAGRRTLDNQLSTQAFYAAESGVNDAIRAIEANTSLQKTDCRTGGAPGDFTYDLDTSLNVGYTCVLINSITPDIQYNSVPVSGNGSPKVFMLDSTGGAINTFSISWDGIGSGAGNTPVNGLAGSYPDILNSAAGWAGGLGVLRIDMVPVDTAANASAFNRDQLAQKSFTFYLVPYAGSGAYTVPPGYVANGSADQIGVAPVRCPGNNTSAGACRVDMTLGNVFPVPGPNTATQYIVRLQAVYNAVKVSMFNFKDSLGNTLLLENGQAIVDVTGKANDVFRRIQVRVPLAVNGVTSPFGLETATAICKRLEVRPTTSVNTSSVNGSDTGSCAIP